MNSSTEISIRLCMDPKTPPLRFDHFVDTKPPYSIALDGYVGEGPGLRRTARGPYLNLNHHEGVDRLATRSTCGQTLMAIRQGLFDLFRTDQGPHALIWTNDCDEDVCTAVFLLENHYLVRSTMNPALNRLVAVEDALDTTAGAYPFPPDLPLLAELNWVFEPYRSWRLGGGAGDPTHVVELVGKRIMAHVTGAGKAIPLDLRFDIIAPGRNFAMVREVGANARTGMLGQGIRAYVSVRDAPGGLHHYTVGKMTSFVDFDVLQILATLDAMEMIQPGADPEKHWGGSDSVGGSPRGTGSLLSPAKVLDTVNAMALGTTEEPA